MASDHPEETNEEKKEPETAGNENNETTGEGETNQEIPGDIMIKHPLQVTHTLIYIHTQTQTLAHT